MHSRRVHGLRRTALHCAAFLGSLYCAAVLAQTTVLDDDHTVVGTGTAVPVEHDFQITAAGTYTVTVTDLGEQFATPLPLSTLEVAVTANDALQGTPVIIEGTGAATSTTPGVGSMTFVAPSSATYPVTYRVHVVGAPASGYSSGPVSTAITNSAGASTGCTAVATTTGSSGTSTACSWDDLIAFPAQTLPSTDALLQYSLTVSTAGNYQVSLNDLALPQALGQLTMILLPSGGSPLLVLPASSGATQGTVTLSAGVTYDVIALGAAASGATGGLYGVSIGPSGGAPVYSTAVPVGSTVQLATTATNPAAGSYTLLLNDLQFPAALQQVAVAAAVDGQAAATLNASGSTSFSIAGTQTGTSGATVQVFGAATPATSPGEGSYAVQVTPQGGSALLSAAQAVTTSGGSVSAYTFNVPGTSGGTALTAGTYTATLTDFQYPAALSVADLAVVQNGTLLGAETATGSFTVTAAAGSASLIVFAQGGLGGSLLDVSLANGSGTLVLDQPQGVGAAFSVTPLSIPSTGNYQISLLDLGWPAQFGTIAGVITQGSTKIGQVVGGGAINSTQLSEGTYYLSIIAAPQNSSSGVMAGTYALNVSSAPAAPTVNFSASATSVTSGGTVQLTWTTTGATSCVGSGGSWSSTYSGSQAASDTVTSPSITSAATFTLTCTGAGGSTAKSVSVSLSTASSSGGHGGGAVDPWLLLVLSGCLVARCGRTGGRGDA